MLTVILDNALVDILHKEVDARHGEGLLGIVADGLIDQCAAAQVELILRDLALVKERDKLIILELIPRLGADIVGEPRSSTSSLRFAFLLFLLLANWNYHSFK